MSGGRAETEARPRVYPAGAQRSADIRGDSAETDSYAPQWPLPDERYAVPAQGLVARDESRALDQRLGDEETVERVAMMPGQGTHRRGMVKGHRERPGARAQERRRKILGRVQLPQGALDGR